MNETDLTTCFSECWFTFYVCGFHDKALHGHALGNQQLSSSSGPASWCCLFETAVSSKIVRRCLLWCLEKKVQPKCILVGSFLSIHALRDGTVCIILHHECNHANQIQRASWFWWFFWNFLLGNHEGGGIDESSCRSYKEQTLAMHLWAVKCLEINRYVVQVMPLFLHWRSGSQSSTQGITDKTVKVMFRWIKVHNK